MYTYMWIYIYIHVYIYMYIYICMYNYIKIYIYIYVYVYLGIVYLDMYVYVYIYMLVYIHIYISGYWNILLWVTESNWLVNCVGEMQLYSYFGGSLAISCTLTRSHCAAISYLFTQFFFLDLGMPCRRKKERISRSRDTARERHTQYETTRSNRDGIKRRRCSQILAYSLLLIHCLQYLHYNPRVFHLDLRLARLTSKARLDVGEPHCRGNWPCCAWHDSLICAAWLIRLLDIGQPHAAVRQLHLSGKSLCVTHTRRHHSVTNTPSQLNQSSFYSCTKRFGAWRRRRYRHYSSPPPLSSFFA